MGSARLWPKRHPQGHHGVVPADGSFSGRQQQFPANDQKPIDIRGKKIRLHRLPGDEPVRPRTHIYEDEIESAQGRSCFAAAAGVLA